eukprot:Rmarinus@m.16133
MTSATTVASRRGLDLKIDVPACRQPIPTSALVVKAKQHVYTRSALLDVLETLTLSRDTCDVPSDVICNTPTLQEIRKWGPFADLVSNKTVHHHLRKVESGDAPVQDPLSTGRKSEISPPLMTPGSNVPLFPMPIPPFPFPGVTSPPHSPGGPMLPHGMFGPPHPPPGFAGLPTPPSSPCSTKQPIPMSPVSPVRMGALSTVHPVVRVGACQVLSPTQDPRSKANRKAPRAPKTPKGPAKGMQGVPPLFGPGSAGPPTLLNGIIMPPSPLSPVTPSFPVQVPVAAPSPPSSAQRRKRGLDANSCGTPGKTAAPPSQLSATAEEFNIDGVRLIKGSKNPVPKKLFDEHAQASPKAKAAA